MGRDVSFQTTFSRFMVCLRKRGIYLLAKLVIALRVCRKYLKGTEKMKPLYILAACFDAHSGIDEAFVKELAKAPAPF